MNTKGHALSFSGSFEEKGLDWPASRDRRASVCRRRWPPRSPCRSCRSLAGQRFKL